MRTMYGGAKFVPHLLAALVALALCSTPRGGAYAATDQPPFPVGSMGVATYQELRDALHDVEDADGLPHTIFITSVRTPLRVALL